MSNNSKHSFVRKFILVSSIFATLIGIFGAAVSLLLGLKYWGINSKIVWGMSIVNFVFWIGNAHSGTLISSILYLLRQRWRQPIHRIAETITIISIVIAAFFPFIHTGRPWFTYWLLPFPNEMGIWFNTKSAITWDVYAVLTYTVLSFLFWVLGIIPDWRYFKFRKNGIFQRFLEKILIKFWIGASFNWNEYRWTYHIFAGILAFVVVSVHTIVAYDFSTSLLPFWHSTSQPVFFVIGAIYSGIALIILLSIVLKEVSSFADSIPDSIFKVLSKILITFSLLIGYFYLIDYFFVFYSQNEFDRMLLQLRTTEPFRVIFFFILLFNLVFPQLLWFKRIRVRRIYLFIISLFVLIGMWLERYLIVIQSLSIDFTSGRIIYYIPTLIDFSLLIGSIGIMVLVFYLISRKIPMIPKSEELFNK